MYTIAPQKHEYRGLPIEIGCELYGQDIIIVLNCPRHTLCMYLSSLILLCLQFAAFHSFGVRGEMRRGGSGIARMWRCERNCCPAWETCSQLVHTRKCKECGVRLMCADHLTVPGAQCTPCPRTRIPREDSDLIANRVNLSGEGRKTSRVIRGHSHAHSLFPNVAYTTTNAAIYMRTIWVCVYISTGSASYRLHLSM